MAFIEQYTSQAASFFGGTGGAAGFFGSLGAAGGAASSIDASALSFGSAIEATSLVNGGTPTAPAAGISAIAPLATSQYTTEVSVDIQTLTSTDAGALLTDQLSSLSLEDFSELFLSGQITDTADQTTGLNPEIENGLDTSAIINEPLVGDNSNTVGLDDIVASLFNTATGFDVSELRPVNINFETITLAPNSATEAAIAYTAPSSTPLETAISTASIDDPLKVLAQSDEARPLTENSSPLSQTRLNGTPATTIAPQIKLAPLNDPTINIQPSGELTELAGSGTPAPSDAQPSQGAPSSNTVNTGADANVAPDEAKTSDAPVQREIPTQQATAPIPDGNSNLSATDTPEVATAAGTATNISTRTVSETNSDNGQRVNNTSTSVDGQVSVSETGQRNSANGQGFNGGNNPNRDFSAGQNQNAANSASHNSASENARNFSDVVNNTQTARADTQPQPVQTPSPTPAPLPATPPLTPEALVATSFGGTAFSSSFGNLLGESQGLFSEPNVFGGRPSEALVGQVRNQFNIAISRAVVNGDQEINIRLNPVELGRVNVQLKFAEEGRLRASIAVENPETLELLQRDARGLERALEASGHKTENGGISFSLENGDQESAGKALAEALQQEQLRDELAARSGATSAEDGFQLTDNDISEEIPLEDILPYVSAETGVDIRI